MSNSKSLARHASHCSICKHPSRKEIELAFISWESPAKIAVEYKLGNRAAVYRLAHALELVMKRSRNLRAALERVIERVDEVEVTPGAVVQAIALYERINTQGVLVEQAERVDWSGLFAQMSRSELDKYAKNIGLPGWFPTLEDVKGPQGTEEDESEGKDEGE